MNEKHGQARADDESKELADALRKGVRALNYATSGPPGLTHVDTVRSVLGSLTEAAQEIHHTLQHLGEFLIDEFRADRITPHRTYKETAEAVIRTQNALAEAAERGERFGGSLSRARDTLNALCASGSEGVTQAESLRSAVRPAPPTAPGVDGPSTDEFPRPLGGLLEQPSDTPPPPSPRRPPGPPSRPSR